MSREDGFKRGTNYCHKQKMAGAAGAEAILLAAASQGARCARGEHDEATAQPNHVTSLGVGVRVEPGTRYCRYCKTILELP